jgi:hypothetical protein
MREKSSDLELPDCLFSVLLCLYAPFLLFVSLQGGAYHGQGMDVQDRRVDPTFLEHVTKFAGTGCRAVHLLS